MSSKDAWCLEQTELMLAPLALLGQGSVKPLARTIFDEMKAEAAKIYGENIYSESLGDQVVANQAVLAKRLAVGLTTEDVRSHWNMPILMRLLQARVREVVDAITLDIARESGKNVVAVARDLRKRHPRYGDPETWNPALPINQGFTSEDADIYPEFASRVGQWQAKTSADKQAIAIAECTSFNAMVRALVRQGQL